MDYKIIVDSREKNPWIFENSITRKLDVADYSLEGFEDTLAIERKASTAEFARNICEPRFIKVLEKLSDIEYGFLILEFNMDDILSFPRNSGIPPKSWSSVHINPYFILKTFLEYQICYNFKVLLCGCHGKDVAKSIFKRVITNEIK